MRGGVRARVRRHARIQGNIGVERSHTKRSGSAGAGTIVVFLPQLAASPLGGMMMAPDVAHGQNGAAWGGRAAPKLLRN